MNIPVILLSAKLTYTALGMVVKYKYQRCQLLHGICKVFSVLVEFRDMTFGLLE